MNTKHGVWLLGILGFITVILLGILIFVPAKKTPAPAVNGISITLPKANSEIFSPLEITGISGAAWGGFEGQVGTVDLLDYKGNNLGTAVLKATTDWTQPPVNFEATLNFVVNNSGPATLVFHNENPSGDPSRDKTFSLPIKMK